MTPRDTAPARRRHPEWRGERDAMLVRVPVPLAEQLRVEAARRRPALSDTTAELIQTALVRGGA